MQLIPKSDVSGNFLGAISVAFTSKHMFNVVSPWDMGDRKRKSSANGTLSTAS